jgi:hypothetical protein
MAYNKRQRKWVPKNLTDTEFNNDPKINKEIWDRYFDTEQYTKSNYFEPNRGLLVRTNNYKCSLLLRQKVSRNPEEYGKCSALCMSFSSAAIYLPALSTSFLQLLPKMLLRRLVIMIFTPMRGRRRPFVLLIPA